MAGMVWHLVDGHLEPRWGKLNPSSPQVLNFKCQPCRHRFDDYDSHLHLHGATVTAQFVRSLFLQGQGAPRNAFSVFSGFTMPILCF